MEMYKGMPGSPITYLTSAISANQTTIAIGDDTALPEAPNLCTIGYGEHIETIRYGEKSNGVLQDVTRGIEGDPRAWPIGTEVARFFTAYDHNAIIQTINEHKADMATQSELGHIKLPENWINATLQNGWTAVTLAQYRRNDFGDIELRGIISEGVNTRGTVLLTLPVGYRPLETVAISSITYQTAAGTGRAQGIRITNDGTVSIDYSADSLEKVSLNNIKFSTK